jgi:hypothetical protein
MHFLSICAILKNEPNLEEWIIYHYIVGVQHFYLYDNESNIPIQSRLLNKPFFQDLCTVIPFPGKLKQIPAYNHCINHFKNDTIWLAVIDGDEYIVPKEDSTITDFLLKRKQAQSIGINWLMFGTSYHITKQKYVIDSFIRCNKNTGENIQIKSIFKPKFVTSLYNPHFVTTKNCFLCRNACKQIIRGPFNHNFQETNKIIQINHYFVRSEEDWRMKQNRGRADTSDNSYKNQKNPHIKDNDDEDTFCRDKYFQKVKELYENIMKDEM